jgi:glyoxylase-like metal-dependent hydrolase (beta-lactamase superfamily II)
MDYPQRLSGRIFILGNHYFSTYLIIGDRIGVLIEPGISSTANVVIDQIKSLGIDPSIILKLILTHAHADHVTGAPKLKNSMPWIVVSSSADTIRLLKKEKVKELFLREDQDISRQLKIMHNADAPENLRTSLNNLVDETICPEQQIDLGGVSLEVINAPGHCIGGLAFWEPAKKALFCSDYLGFFLPSDRFVPNFYVDFQDYMTTFESLVKLHPYWVCPGHCGAYAGDDTISYINRSREEIEWIYHRVLENNESYHSIDKALRKELFDRYYLREATMFSKQSTEYCMQLLVRRIADTKGRIAISKD